MYGKDHQFDMESFRENQKTIKPITFVNGKLDNDSNLNSLFTLPYDLALLGRATSNTMAMQAKEAGVCSEETFEEFAYDLQRQSVTNHIDAIYAYLFMNCRDFVFTYLANMFNNIVGEVIPPLPEKYRYYDEDEMYDNYRYQRNFYTPVNIRELDDVIKSCLDKFVFGSSTIKDLPPIYYYQLMNNMYTQIIIYTDSIIRRMADRKFMHDKGFEDLMIHVYGDINGMTGNKFSEEFKYTFATSIIREMVEKKLPELYQGLHFIFQTAASMAYVGANPVYQQDILSIEGSIGNSGYPVIEPHECDGSCGANCTCNHHEESPADKKSRKKKVTIVNF